MVDYYEFKNIFLPSTVHESQIAIPRNSSNISTPVFSDDSSTGSITKSQSQEYSDSEAETEVFEHIETTYQIIGVVRAQCHWNPEMWIVDINEPEQIEKIGKPSLKAISGLFKYTNSESVPIRSRVRVEITYANNGNCLWKENKIISLIE